MPIEKTAKLIIDLIPSNNQSRQYVSGVLRKEPWMIPRFFLIFVCLFVHKLPLADRGIMCYNIK